MPDYRTYCRECENVWDQHHLMREPHEPCPKCRSTSVNTHIESMSQVRVRPALDQGWEGENQGSGRYFPQFEDSIDCSKSRKNCFRSRSEAIEEGKRRGFTFLEK